MPAKVCPRCGEQYEHLHSTTCPSCFAKLVIVDDATAQELADARAGVVQTPEFQAAKTVDDERFREQSFGACLGVLAIFLVTAAAAVVLLVHAARHAPARLARTPAAPAARRDPAATLPALPVAAGVLDDVLPPAVGPDARLSADQAVNIPGTLTPIFHARYGPAASATDAYAVPTDRPTPELNAFQLGLALASQSGSRPAAAPPIFFATEHWRYAVLAPSPASADTFRTQLVGQFEARSR